MVPDPGVKLINNIGLPFFRAITKAVLFATITPYEKEAKDYHNFQIQLISHPSTTMHSPNIVSIDQKIV